MKSDLLIISFGRMCA